MKKILIIAAAFLVSATAFGQKKGDMYVGGGLTLGAGTSSYTTSYEGTSSTTKGSTPVTFSISPSFGYFLWDNIRVGGSLAYGVQAQPDSYSTHTFMVGPEAAYYLRLADKFYYTPELGLYGGLYADSTHSGSTTTTTTWGAFSVGLSLAQVEFRPLGNIAFAVDVMNMGYVYRSRTENDIKRSYGSFNFDLNASVAVRYYF